MTIFDSIRQILSQGDTAEALRMLIDYLEREKSSPEALRALRVIEANYQAARQKELKGILNFQEARQVYSKTNDDILGVVDDLAAGRVPALTVPVDNDRQKNRIYWLIGGGILLLLGAIVGILLLQNKPEAPAAAPAAPPDCPMFDTSGITIMLIPFSDLGDTKSKPELAIQSLIRDLTDRNKVKSDVQIFRGKQFDNNPPDVGDAANTGRNCAAKMVIWGNYEKVNEGISVDIRYVFTELPNLPSGAIADTFRNLTELRSDRAKFNNLEEAVFSLCTFMALHEGNMELAEKWINKLKAPSQRTLEIKKMLRQR